MTVAAEHWTRPRGPGVNGPHHHPDFKAAPPGFREGELLTQDTQRIWGRAGVHHQHVLDGYLGDLYFDLGLPLQSQTWAQSLTKKAI